MKSMLAPIAVICLFSAASEIKGQKSSPEEYNLLIGTYTSPNQNKGIYCYSFNSKTGAFSYKSAATGIKNPSFLTLSKDGRQLYAVSEVGDGKGSISAFKFDGISGKLTYLNNADSGGNGPCYVSVDAKNKFVFSGNYGSGSVAAIPVMPDGALGSAIQSIQHKGSSINPGNQEGPHVHAAVLSEDNRYLFVPDLGTDKLNIYKVDLSKPEPLTAGNPPFISVAPGSGPRHITFHPNGKTAYLIQEINGVITGFNYENGKLHPFQSIAMPPPGFDGKIDAADIHISPDGKFIYGSLRGDLDELVIYALADDGKMTYAGRQPTLGETPRNFAIDPSGNFLLVGNQNSDSIVIFKRNHKTGLLSPTGQTISIPSPVCLIFAPIK